VAAVAVGEDVKQHGALFFFQDLSFPAVGVDHRQGVVAVDPFGMELGGVKAGADTGGHAVTHCFPAGLTSHAVLVVHDVDDQGEASLHVALPQFGKLVHGGEGKSFPNRSASQGGIPDIGDHNALFTVDFFEEGCAYGDIA